MTRSWLMFALFCGAAVLAEKAMEARETKNKPEEKPLRVRFYNSHMGVYDTAVKLSTIRREGEYFVFKDECAAGNKGSMSIKAESYAIMPGHPRLCP
jgi:hypothetical protein